MAQKLNPDQDPIVSRSYALHYLIATVLMVGTMFWALWDEAYGTRPWKAFQSEFNSRYSRYLKDAKSSAEKSDKERKASPEYKELDDAVKAADAAAKPQRDEIRKKVQDLDAEIAKVQTPFTDARAHVSADTYSAETSSGSSRTHKLEALARYKSEPQFKVKGEGDRKYSFLELEARFLDLKAKKAALIAQLAEVNQPMTEAAQKRDAYVAQNMDGLLPSQVTGLQAKVDKWDPKIVQINVPEANMVDRCESCHMGIREPLTLTSTSLLRKPGAKPDSFSRAFVSHPEPDLLNIHNPDKFGCSACHGGNGRATSSVEKAHGENEHWLQPLFAKENMEAGCQTCHSADMVLVAGSEAGPIIDAGKDLFRQRGCMGCHRYEGYDREPEDLLSLRQTIKSLENQKKDNMRQAKLLMAEADKAADNTEANRLNQQAENLKVGVSGLEAHMEQADLQSRAVLRDMKKVGPNLKEAREKLNKNWIPVWLKKPTDFRPTTKMPNFRLTDQQIRQISAYIWQSAINDPLPQQKPGNAAHGKDLFETRGCMACHSMGEGDQMQGGTFAANLTRLGEKANYDYIVRWVHNPRERTRPYCPYEHKDIGPEDYAKKGLAYVFDFDHSTCPNDGHELQIQQMTVMPNLRLSPEDAADIATYLMTMQQKDPRSYPDAAFMDDPSLKEAGRGWIRHYGCAGCHEIAGFEDEGRIGTELTAEGSKPIERLDFALLTHPAKGGGKDPITGQNTGEWYNHKGFFEHKLAMPNVFDKGKESTKGEKELLRMPDPHLTRDQIRALTTFLLGSQEPQLPASYLYRPADSRRDVQEGWWLVKKYNCMGCHQIIPGQSTTLMGMAKYQDPDWKEQLPPKLLTEGARVDPTWLTRFLSNPSLSTTDTNRNGVRPYLKARMPTFNFSENELRKLVRFFQAYSQQPLPYIPQRIESLTAQETDMARALFTSTAAPCLKCHATGDPNHDRIATAPNFLMVKERLKPGWTERWIIDPQAMSPGTSMPSGLFRKQGDQWVFAGPVPDSFHGYSKDHTKLLVRYMFQLTPEEQKRAAARMPAAGKAPAGAPKKTAGAVPRPAQAGARAPGAGSR